MDWIKSEGHTGVVRYWRGRERGREGEREGGGGSEGEREREGGRRKEGASIYYVSYF